MRKPPWKAGSGIRNSSRIAHNYFGIKARSGAQKYCELPTWESVDGEPVRITARFARFASMAECFAARDRMIADLPVYADARAAAGDPETFVRALARRWATDPDYAEKVLRIYRGHGLDQLDRTSV